MWLSHIPSPIPGHFIALTSKGEVREAFDKQAADDWKFFLSLRSAELRPGGRLVVCDARSIHAVLFGPIVPGHEVGNRTRRVTLFSVAVDGVPSIHVEEALWLTVDALMTKPS